MFIFRVKYMNSHCTCQLVSIQTLYLRKCKSWPLSLYDYISMVMGFPFLSYNVVDCRSHVSIDNLFFLLCHPLLYCFLISFYNISLKLLVGLWREGYIRGGCVSGGVWQELRLTSRDTYPHAE